MSVEDEASVRINHIKSVAERACKVVITETLTIFLIATLNTNNEKTSKPYYNPHASSY